MVEIDYREKLCGIINGREKPMVDIDYREKLCEYVIWAAWSPSPALSLSRNFLF